MKSLRSALLIGASAVVASFAFVGAAQALVITNTAGTFSVGIGPDGELYDSGSGIGFRRNADGFDPLAPGTPRDSWGVSANGSSAYADYENSGTYNISSTSSSSTASTATFTSMTNFGLNVSQGYSFAAPNVLKISETITNTSGVTASSVLFQRDIDWDVAPTEFDENSFGPSVAGNVIDSSYYGFESADPLVPYSSSCAAGCNNTGDLGGGIKISLGSLAAGASDTFNFYYALTESGQNADGLLSQVGALGVNYAITTQSSENGSYPNLGSNAALIGYGTVSGVPLPASAPMFGIALLALGAVTYGAKRKKAGASA